MSDSRRKYNNKNKRDKDFVPKSGLKRIPREVTSVEARKVSKLQEQETSYDKCVADLFSLSDAELDQANQVVQRMNNVNLFFARNTPTPLQIAAACGDLEAVKKTITTEAGVDNCTGCGQTALFLATEAGHVAVVRELLRCRANPDTINYRALLQK